MAKENPFKNDPFVDVWEAFKNLYPNVECECYYDISPDKGEVQAMGECFFEDDGKTIIYIDMYLNIADATEILCHELAHAAVGFVEEDEHGEKWEAAFDAIHDEYERIVYSYGVPVRSVKSIGGKDYYKGEYEL